MNSSADSEGGEAPCWAHLVEEPEPALGPLSWEALVHRLADAVVIADAEGTITYWNNAAERLFGWPAAETLGRNLDMIIPERLRERHREGYARVARTGQTKYGTQLLEVPALHKTGKPLSIAFTLTLVPGSDGGVARFVAVIRDDTERWQERRALRAELGRVRSPTQGGAATGE